MAPKRRWRWLESTVALQRDAYDHDWEAIGRTDRRVSRSIKDNLWAAVVEIGEVAREFSWKSWSAGKPFVNRRRVLEEVVDVLHFLANVLIALGVSDDELEREYQRKQEVNRERQRAGYVARSGKE